jgi:nucleotidyltransferase/DNA polymerase involved in DNA repair
VLNVDDSQYSVLQRYDPKAVMMSLDEAKLDITDLCIQRLHQRKSSRANDNVLDATTQRAERVRSITRECGISEDSYAVKKSIGEISDDFALFCGKGLTKDTGTFPKKVKAVADNSSQIQQSRSDEYGVKYDSDEDEDDGEEGIETSAWEMGSRKYNGEQQQQHEANSRALFAEAERVVAELRDTVKRERALTCSAGIACNFHLAKLVSNFRKPDGQFLLEPTR